MSDQNEDQSIHEQLRHIRHRLESHQSRLDGHDAELTAIGAALDDVNAQIDQLVGQKPTPSGGTGLVAIIVQPRTRPEFTYTTGGSLMASVDLPDNKELQFDLAEEDAFGNPVTNGPTPSWQVADSSKLVISNMSNDGLHAVVQPVGPEGASDVNISVDVPQPDGTTQTLTGSFTVNVTAGPVSQLQVTPGTPADKGTSTLPPVAPPAAPAPPPTGP